MSELLRLIIPNPDNPEATTMLVPSKEDSAHIPVDNVDTKNGQEGSGGDEERYFVITNIQEGQHIISEGVGDTEEEVMNGERTVNEETVMQEQVGISESEERPAWLDLCRVCANVNDHLIPIFEGEGLQHELCDKIHKYLPIRVCEEDTLPLHLCYHCAATLLAWHELLEGCLNAERKLLEMQESTQEKEQGLEAVAQDADLEPNIVEQPLEELESVKEDACKESTVNDPDRFGLPSKKPLAAYYSRHTSTTFSNNIKRPKTNYVVPVTINEMNSNTKIETMIFKNDNVLANTNIFTITHPVPLSNQYICKTCQRVFKREPHLTRHASKCGSKAVNNIEETRRDTSSHADTTSGDETEDMQNKDDNKNYCKHKMKQPDEYFCTHCNYATDKKKLLRIHIMESHPEFFKKKDKHVRCIDQETVLLAKKEIDGKIYYHCNECGKNLHSPYTFSWHVRIHTGERPYTCHLCGKQFRVNQGLTRHVRDTHAHIKNYSCDLCGRRFSTKRHKEDHRRIHTGERPFICNACGKAFKQKASLVVHNRTHSDVFPFKCTYCELSFRTRPRMMVHITKHTGEKPHACDICGRCFRLKYELNRHRLIHFDEKPWQCTECDLSFRQKRYLVSHRKVNHKTNTLVAPVK